jgi:glucose/arabinose dehydrogenase/N-acetylneuraminic acid mutarotase
MSSAGAATCSPLACSEILVDLPYELDFGGDHGKILDGNGVGTGFTHLDRPTNATGYIPQNLKMNTAAPGTLDVTTTPGIMYQANDSQDNALAVGIAAPNQVSVLETTLLDPPAGSGNLEQAGLWFGNDEDNHVKLAVISTAGGTKIEYLMEVNGQQSAKQQTGVLNLGDARVALSLRAVPDDRTITASYRVDGGQTVRLATFTAPSEFFSFDAAGIDPTIGTRSFGGIYATHRNGSTPLTYTFDDFSVTVDNPPPAPQDFSFNRSSFPVPNPTSMAWGPDGRLYVTELFGTIHALKINDAKEVVSDRVITTLGSRLTLGISVDPESTPSNVVLWVSHSSPSTSNGALNSSKVTRLSGPDFTTRNDVITGLPRAIANHGVNAVHFGSDGKLYIAAGGNTGAGAPNMANTEFGPRAEQPLSAALLVADVRAAGFDGSCATPENTYGPSPCDVVPYSTGLRNMYDFVFHSNGSIYGPDNGLGVTGTYPPSPTDPCIGLGDPTLWTQGGEYPGDQPDNLNRLVQGKYYGHPNPYRNGDGWSPECVFKDGTYQGVAAPSKYVPPMYDLGAHKSADGIIEYAGGAFGGALAGDLFITNYSVGDDITRVELSSDGRSVVKASRLAGGFSNPLPITEGPDGTIYVGEFGADKVTALEPRTGTWTTKQPMPQAILDAGGTALDGKLYVVAGKTTAGHRSAMDIYDPSTDSWTTGPSLPGPAVENPAVVTLNGKLYVFGGSTSAFSGAVHNAAVYDPTSKTWTRLAPLATARAGATAQAIDGKLYVVGGMGPKGSSLAGVEVYDPTNNTWTKGTDMKTRRDNPGSATLGGKLYVFGGRTRNADGTTLNGTLASVERFNPATGTWAARTPMPTGRRTVVVGTLGGRAQVMGGEKTSTGATFAANEEYDSLADNWTKLTPMPTSRHGAVAGTINGVVYVAGGGPQGGTSFTNVNEAFTP